MPENYSLKLKKGLNEKTVKQISLLKKEPLWMKNFRLRAFSFFEKRKMPSFGADLSDIDFNNIHYYVKPVDKKASSWEELPSEIKTTYDRIGIPEIERKILVGGVSAQYESEVVYKSIQDKLYKKAFFLWTWILDCRSVLTL